MLVILRLLVYLFFRQYRFLVLFALLFYNLTILMFKWGSRGHREYFPLIAYPSNGYKTLNAFNGLKIL